MRISTLRIADDHGTVATFSQSIGRWVNVEGEPFDRASEATFEAFGLVMPI